MGVKTLENSRCVGSVSCLLMFDQRTVVHRTDHRPVTESSLHKMHFGFCPYFILQLIKPDVVFF